MKTINRNATNITPAVTFAENSKLLIKGRSIAEDVLKFYQPLIDWAGKLNISSLTVDINLEYVNSSSSKKLFSLLKVLDTNTSIKDLTINWFYEEGDEDSLEKGRFYEKLLLKAKFRYYRCAEAV